VLGVLAGPGGDIEISLGANKGTIHKGQRLSVYRTGPDGTTRVGDVEVVEVKPDRSICKPLPEFQKGAIQKGDRVATTQLTFSAYATKPTQVKVLHAVNGDALSYAEILSVLPAVSEKKVLVVVDARTNNLVISGPKEDLAVLEALVVRLDAKAPTAPKPKSDEGKLPER
jgi:type II secretory pathway component GspD/PulD (secretin)